MPKTNGALTGVLAIVIAGVVPACTSQQSVLGHPTSESATALPAAPSFAGADALARSFAEAFGKDMETLGHRVARADPNDPESRVWLLMRVRPRHAGRFIFRYQFDTPKREAVNQEYYVVVSNAGVPRLLDWRSGGMQPRPIACAGDELIVPFALQKRFTNPYFTTEPDDARLAQIWFDFQEKAPDDPAPRNDFAVDNGAAAHFKLVSSDTADTVAADGRRHINAMGVMLEAREPGKFNLSIDAGDSRARRIVPVVVVAKDHPLQILAAQCEHSKRSGGASSSWTDRHDLKTLVLRVGDRVMLPVYSFVINEGIDPARPGLPKIKLAELPFVPESGSFGFVDGD